VSVVDAKDRLRQYLEQRKEMGEQDLVLDGLSVDEVLKVLGAPLMPGVAPADAAKAGNPRISGVHHPAQGSAPTQSLRERPAPPITKPVAAAKPAAAAEGEPISVGGSIAEIAGATHASRLATLQDVADAVARCKLCSLHGTAKNPVPGEGNPEAKFVCVGEAPGATEDETGRPFVGAAGQLLTKILAAINFQREDVFICNVLKHRPPGNRNPQPDEITACSPYLLQQLSILQPRVILALGTFAAQTLLQTTRPIGKLRGQIHRFYGVPLVVTYHPAALLRNPNWKRPTWEDVQLARRVFDNAVGA
jgi:uracil-DNA glycosylase family 4